MSSLAIGVGDVVDDRVVLGPEVVDDLDRVGGDARRGRAAVVALERRVALRREEVGDGEAPGLGVAALAPVDLDALLLGLGERQRERDLAAAAARRCSSARCRSLPSSVGAAVSVGSSCSVAPVSAGRLRRRRRAVVVRGIVVVIAADVATSTPATIATTATIAAIGPHRLS